MIVTEAPTLPWVLEPAAAGCAVLDYTGMTTGPSRCAAEPTGSALVRYPHAGHTWRVFLCSGHAQHVPGAQPLDPPRIAELRWRRDELARALAGQTYTPPTPINIPTRHRHGHPG